MGIDELDELEDEMDEKVFLEYRQFNQNRLVKPKKKYHSAYSCLFTGKRD